MVVLLDMYALHNTNIYRICRYILLVDILNITDAQARVLRAIAYYEIDSNQKGATQYTCLRKVPDNYRVSDSTFHDNIKKLQENVMVTKLKTEGKSKPVTITDIGQIAWLRRLPIKENLGSIQKIFPNILIFQVDEIINQIPNQDIKIIKDEYASTVLKIALNSFHIEQTYPTVRPFYKDTVNEIIDLSSNDSNIKTSFSRSLSVIHPSILSKIKQRYTQQEYDEHFFKNYDELEINIIDRVTFLFYYILIQSVMFEEYAENIILENIILKGMAENDKEITHAINKYSQLPSKITKTKRKVIKIITSNEAIHKIIEKNFEQLKNYKNTDFQKIYDFFIKK